MARKTADLSGTENALSSTTEPNNLVRRLRPGATESKGVAGASFLIDTHFPGGNAIIESIDGDTVRLRPDARDSEGGWFYWAIRVRGAGGKSLTFIFSEQNPVGVYGPAVSLDEGVTWQWLGNPDGSTDSFRCAFPQKAVSVRLSLGINYTDMHWQRFCGRISRHTTFVREDILCLSRKGRTVPRLHVGNLDGKPKYRILLTARHHACETMANYAIEGVVLAALTDDELGAWFRKNVELVVLPFMDRDGSEDGDQGKGRRPHDHNHDYSDDGIYPETKALRDFAIRWSDQRLVFMADLHCPWIRGNSHEEIFQVAKTDTTIWAEQRFFGDILAKSIRGPLQFNNVDHPNFGDEWRAASGQNAGGSPADWFAKLAGMSLATTLEIPYSNCSGVRVTADSVRVFGHDLASAMRQYLEEIAGGTADKPASKALTAKLYTGPDTAPIAVPTTTKAPTSRMAAESKTPADPAQKKRIIIHTKKR